MVPLAWEEKKSPAFKSSKLGLEQRYWVRRMQLLVFRGCLCVCVCVCVCVCAFDHGLPSRWQDNGKVGVNET